MPRTSRGDMIFGIILLALFLLNQTRHKKTGKDKKIMPAKVFKSNFAASLNVFWNAGVRRAVQSPML